MGKHYTDVIATSLFLLLFLLFFNGCSSGDRYYRYEGTWISPESHSDEIVITITRLNGSFIVSTTGGIAQGMDRAGSYKFESEQGELRGLGSALGNTIAHDQSTNQIVILPYYTRFNRY